MKKNYEIERDLNQILQMLDDPEFTRKKYNLKKTEYYDDYPYFMIGYIRSNIKSLLEK